MSNLNCKFCAQIRFICGELHVVYVLYAIFKRYIQYSKTTFSQSNHINFAFTPNNVYVY